MMHVHVSFYLQFSYRFWQILYCLVSRNQHFWKRICGTFLQEPCHKLDVHWILVLWTWRQTSHQLWCLGSSSISCRQWVRVQTLWHWYVTRKTHLLLYYPCDPFRGGLPSSFYCIGYYIALTWWTDPTTYCNVHPQSSLPNQPRGIFLVLYL